jgi:hypothetical protein
MMINSTIFGRLVDSKMFTFFITFLILWNFLNFLIGLFKINKVEIIKPVESYYIVDVDYYVGFKNIYKISNWFIRFI